VTRLAGLMTMAIRFSTTALDGGDGATAKVTEMENLRQDLGTLLFEGGEGIGQGAPPIRTYSSVRIRRVGPRNCTPRPSRPGGLHPEPLTDSGHKPLDLSGSCHPLKAAAFHRDRRVPPVNR